MRIPQTKEQRTKACLHGVQALLIFIAACLTLAVYTTEGSTGSEIGFFFAVVRPSDRHGSTCLLSTNAGHSAFYQFLH
jgi:hypothetical protein